MYDKETVSALVQFLSDEKPSVQKIALQSVRQMSSTHDAKILLVECGALAELSKLALCSQDTLAHEAIASLINLSVDIGAAQLALVERSLMIGLIERCLDMSDVVGGLATLLLSNLTVRESLCQLLLFGKHEQNDEQHNVDENEQKDDRRLVDDSLTLLSGLLHTFLTDEAQSSAQGERWAQRVWVAQVLANLSQVHAVRVFLLDGGALIDLLPLIGHANPVCRRGVVHVVRNCLFELPRIERLLGVSRSERPVLLCSVLQRVTGTDLIGGTDDAVPAESESVMRCALVECLALMAMSPVGRQQMQAGEAIGDDLERLYSLIVDDSQLWQQVLNRLRLALEGTVSAPTQDGFLVRAEAVDDDAGDAELFGLEQQAESSSSSAAAASSSSSSSSSDAKEEKEEEEDADVELLNNEANELD
jgi:Domain of unknown function (DUF383)